MPDNLADILESPEHTLLATDLGNTEGPLWHPEGYLTFVDLIGNRLLDLLEQSHDTCRARHALDDTGGRWRQHDLHQRRTPWLRQGVCLGRQENTLATRSDGRQQGLRIPCDEQE